MEDLYSILGVESGADADSIKNAYRRLATKYHPDKTGGDKTAEASLKKINHAYSILGDADKRAQYDRGGTGDSPFGGFGGFDSNGGGFSQGPDLSSIFEGFDEIFGQPGARTRGGADVAQRVTVSFEEAYKGIEKTLRVRLKQACAACKGTGAKGGTEFKTCEKCGGGGILRVQRGMFSMQQTCPSCGGRGKRIKKACADCDGKGVVLQAKEIRVKIPAGIHDGDRIRMQGQGEFGGGRAGDLYVLVRVGSHPVFQHDGADLLCEMPVNLADAALGCKVLLPLPDGKISVKVPPGTQAGDVLRLRGKGMPDPQGGPRGNLLCQIRTETPVNLNTEQKDLLAKLKASLEKNGKKHSPGGARWTEQLKKFFH